MAIERIELASNEYGKSAIRLVKVLRDGPRHTLQDLTVNVRLQGEFAAAHIDGENAGVLPTDTMKNTVYALARLNDLDPPEGFGAIVAARLLEAAPLAATATVEIARHAWARVTVHGRPYDSAFEHGSAELRIARVRASRTAAPQVEAGVQDLFVLRTAGSAFSDFPRDKYTTLKETRDRIFATSVTARWRYRAESVSHNVAFAAVRLALLEIFATHPSESVQHTLYAMGTAALESCQDIEDIRLSLPNRHHLLVDLSPFNLDNPNQIFVATAEPYGVIEATLRRGG